MRVMKPVNTEQDSVTTNIDLSLDVATYGSAWKGAWSDATAEYLAGEVVYKSMSIFEALRKNGKIPEIQTLSMGNANSGTFTLSDGSTTTSALAYNASSATIQSALLSIYGTGNVTVSDSGSDKSIEFAYSVGDSNITADFSSLEYPALEESAYIAISQEYEQPSDPVLTNNEVSPENPAWLYIGATNPYRMFDNIVGTETVGAAPSTSASTIEVDIDFAYTINAISLFGVDAYSEDGKDVSITVTDGVLSWSADISLTHDPIIDFQEFFFSPLVDRESSWVITLPTMFLSGSISLTIRNDLRRAKCGLVLYGWSDYVGQATYGIGTGIMDFSIKEKDSYGRTFLREGKFAKIMKLNLFVPNELYDRTQRLLSKLRATNCVWDANQNGTDYSSFVVYGFPRDFRLVMQGPSTSECSLDIEGLV